MRNTDSLLAGSTGPAPMMRLLYPAQVAADMDHTQHDEAQPRTGGTDQKTQETREQRAALMGNSFGATALAQQRCSRG